MMTRAAIAAREYALRRQAALRAVAADELTRDRAEAMLRPWAAIALLAGADVPELAEEVAWRVDDATPIAFARAIVALYTCDRAEWVPALATARDRAVEAAQRNPEHVERAHGLQRLARYFAHDPAGLHHMPPYQPQSADPASSSGAVGGDRASSSGAVGNKHAPLMQEAA